MRKMFFIAFCCTSFCATSQTMNPGMPEAENGVLDARTWNFTQQKIALNGYWNFYQNEFVSRADSTQGPARVSLFPEVWDPSIQYGSYQLVVALPVDTGRMAIELPQIYCSYELWVNGK